MNKIIEQTGNSIPEIKKFKPPKGYLCTAKGVQKLVEDGDNEHITFKPVEVTAISKDHSDGNYGLLVWWISRSGKDHEIALSIKLLHTSGTELVQYLAENGLHVVYGKERELLRYLSLFNPNNFLTSASCTGWLGESFILPNESINEPKNERIVYQPQGMSSISKAIKKSGSFQAWQSGMKNVSPMIMFLICAGLSAPVRYKAGIESGGFHIYDLTSQGKTTGLQAVSSIWGNGVDPAIAGGDEAYIQRWNSTANALEGKAESFNDLAFVIDEIGEGDSREFGQTIYRIISGTGRSRAGRNGDLRDSKSWRVAIISAGEVAISDFIASGGKTVKGGQMVRMIDLDLASIGKLFNSSDEADAMKELCATHYGHAGAEMLKQIPDLAYAWKEFNHSTIGEAITPIAKRVRKRFALVAYTGMIACRAGVLPWVENDIISSVENAYKSWHGQINTVSDIDRGVMAVRDFIFKHESRFELPNVDFAPTNRAGWYRDNMYHFTPEAFKEACAGGDPTKVKRALKDAGILHINKGGLQSTIKVSGKSVSVASISAEILSKSLKKGSASGVSSAESITARVKSGTTLDNQVVPGSATEKQIEVTGTTGTTYDNKVVPGGNRINKGLAPPAPVAPTKNDNLENYDANFSEVI